MAGIIYVLAFRVTIGAYDRGPSEWALQHVNIQPDGWWRNLQSPDPEGT
jgi:hypothetical protein